MSVGLVLTLAWALLAAGALVPAQEAVPDEPRHARVLGISLASDAPMKIRSDELEAAAEGAEERVIFLHNVEVLQEDLRLTCDWLEVVYARDRTGGPASIHARGEVRIRQAETDVACTEMVFDRAEGEAVCTAGGGWAVLRRGEDVIEGKRIEFDLRNNIVRVLGGARVRMRPENEQAKAAEEAVALPPVAEPSR